MSRFIHIGIPKSGTTTVQKSFLNDPRIILTRSTFYNASNWWLKPPNQTKANKVILESNETLISGGFNKVKFFQVVERIHKFNKNAHIIITIRKQDDAIISMFKYHIVNNFKGTISLQNWMYNTNLGMDYLSICMYGSIAKLLLNYFPKEQIHFLFFEELKDNPNQFYKKFYNILEIPLEDKYLCLKPQNVTTFNNSQLYTLSKFNRFSFTSIDDTGYNPFKTLRKLENKIKKNLVKRFSIAHPNNFFKLEKVQGFQKIKEEFKESNRFLGENGFVSLEDLKKFKYLI